MQTYLNQQMILFKKTANMIQGPSVDQHEYMIFVIIRKQIKSLSTFSIKYKYCNLIITIQIAIMIPHKGVGVTPAGVTFRHFGLAVRSADNSVTTFLYINNLLHSFI